MRLLIFASGVALAALAVQGSWGQSIPLTVAEAEGEGASFPHAAPPTVLQSLFVGSFGGTSTRTCAPSPPDESMPGGSLRSGDIIIRSRLTGQWGLHAGRAHKILWAPLHGPSDTSKTVSFAEWRKEAIHHAPLLIRAVRVGHPSDSVRQIVKGLTGGPREFGFPSEVTFSTAGQWLVIARTDEDWGCFLLRVAE
jgi:hypothetical protein